MFICNTATCAMMCPILKVRFLVILILMMVMVMGLNCHPTPPVQVVLEQVYWKEKSKDEEGVEGDGKALTRKQNLEHTRQDQEKVPTI